MREKLVVSSLKGGEDEKDQDRDRKVEVDSAHSEVKVLESSVHVDWGHMEPKDQDTKD